MSEITVSRLYGVEMTYADGMVVVSFETTSKINVKRSLRKLASTLATGEAGSIKAVRIVTCVPHWEDYDGKDH